MTASAPNYRFARTPKWVLSHVLVALLLIAMISAGFWQLDRHRQRRGQNDLIEARSQLERVPFATVAPPGVDSSVGEQEQYRRVEVTGVFQADDEVLIRNRTFDGAPGWWVLTPLMTDDGWAVAVNRGWIPLSYHADEPRRGTEAPAERVTVLGWIQPSRQAEGFQRADPSAGRLSSLARPDVPRLSAQVGYEMSPVVLRVDPASMPAGVQPIPLPLPAFDSGSHLSYAVQWFIFSTTAVIGYPLVLRSVARGRQDAAPEPDQLRRDADQSRGRR